MDKEFYTISSFESKFIGDDAAVVEKWVYSKDIFLENTHFKRGWLSLFEIGKKAMMVNISDAVAMNAKPKFALLGLMLPKNFSYKDIDELKRGIDFACKKHNLTIIGGDTVRAESLGLSVTIIAWSKSPIFRAVKAGEILAFTGSLGGSLKGLKAFLNLGKPSRNSRFRDVVLRDKFMFKTAKFINSAMDISDGLRSDLPKFLGQNSVKFSYKFRNNEFKSGEEYELLISFDRKNLKRVKNEAKKARVKLTIFGKVVRGRYKKYGKNEHF